MKKLLLLLLIMAIVFMSCEKDDLNETPVPEARIIGEWETFKVEKQELILDFNTDGSPDTTVNSSINNSDFIEREHTVSGLGDFIAFDATIHLIYYSSRLICGVSYIVYIFRVKFFCHDIIIPI